MAPPTASSVARAMVVRIFMVASPSVGQELTEVRVERRGSDALAPGDDWDQLVAIAAALGVEVLPDDLALPGDLEQAAAVGLGDQRVAVGQPLLRRAHPAVEAVL